MIPGMGQFMLPMSVSEPRQVTSNVGFLKKPTVKSRVNGLDRYYYSLVIDWRKYDLEEQMLLNLNKKDWISGLKLPDFEKETVKTQETLANMSKYTELYCERVKSEIGKTPEEIEVMNVGKLNPKKHLENSVQDLMSSAILMSLGMMIDTVVF